jgi:ABC-2 type transport system permease protein
MSTTAVEVLKEWRVGATMSSGRLARAYVTEARYELVRALRNLGFSLPFLLLPVALYLLFGVVLFGDALKNEPKAAINLFISFAIMGVMGPALFGFGVFIATERDQGLLTLKRALPAPPAAYLLARAVMSVVFSVVIMIAMILAGFLIGHLRLSAWQFSSVAVVNTLGSVPFCALGLFVGTRVPGKSAPAFVNLLYLPMIYLSGFFFPLPKSIQWIQFFSPAFYLDQLAMQAVGAPSYGPAVLHIAALGCLTLLLGGLAVRRLARVG